MTTLLRGRRALAIFALFVAAHFLSTFLRSTNAAIAPDLSRDLGLSAAQLGLMTSLFYASFALVQLPMGAALDRFGTRRVTPTLMLITVGGCLLFAASRSFAGAALGRALIGVGLASVLMGAIKVYGQWLPSNRVATISGFMVGISSLGGLFASTPLAWLNQAVGWRTIFVAAAPIVLASAAAILIGVRNSPPGASAPSRAPGDTPQAGFRQIFGDTRFWRIGLVTFFLFGTMQAVQSLWAGLYLFDVVRLGKLDVGNVLLALNIGLVAGYFSSGWLAERFGMVPVMIGVAAVFFITLLALALLGLWLPLPLLALVLFAFGFCGSFNVVLLAQVRLLFPPQMTGRALTAVNMLGFLGTALIQWLMGVIISAFVPDAQGHYPMIAYTAAFLFTATGTGLALMWYATLLRATPEGKRQKVQGKTATR